MIFLWADGGNLRDFWEKDPKPEITPGLVREIIEQLRGMGFNIDAIGMSPATPYYLSQRNKLVQQTCPPKQLQQGLFPRAGSSEEPSQKLRTKLEAARRKSMAYKPKVGSPLIE